MSKLEKSRTFKNDKIIISYSIYSTGESFNVYLLDEKGIKHHVFFEKTPMDYKCFDQTSENIKVFVKNKVDEWVVLDQEDAVLIKKKRVSNKQNEQQKELQKLIDSF